MLIAVEYFLEFTVYLLLRSGLVFATSGYERAIHVIVIFC